jgi:hypothetical protein
MEIMRLLSGSLPQRRLSVVWNQNFRSPIVVLRSTLVSVDNERVTRWSEYYDGLTSRRYLLAGMFKEWIEY